MFCFLVEQNCYILPYHGDVLSCHHIAHILPFLSESRSWMLLPYSLLCCTCYMLFLCRIYQSWSKYTFCVYTRSVSRLYKYYCFLITHIFSIKFFMSAITKPFKFSTGFERTGINITTIILQSLDGRFITRIKKYFFCYFLSLLTSSETI